MSQFSLEVLEHIISYISQTKYEIWYTPVRNYIEEKGSMSGHFWQYGEDNTYADVTIIQIVTTSNRECKTTQNIILFNLSKGYTDYKIYKNAILENKCVIIGTRYEPYNCTQIFYYNNYLFTLNDKDYNKLFTWDKNIKNKCPTISLEKYEKPNQWPISSEKLLEMLDVCLAHRKANFWGGKGSKRKLDNI